MTTLGLFLACLAAVQSPDASPSATWHIVDADQVIVRSGADRNFYGFLEAPRGSVVEVTEVLNNWGRTPARGPLFDQAWGWIRHPQSEAGRFSVSDDRRGLTLDKMPVYAPDLTNENPSRAWRQLCILPEDTAVDVLSMTTGEMDGQPFQFYRVRLPEIADGWINMANLRVADPEEILNPSTDAADRPAADDGDQTVPDSTSDRSADGQPSYLARYLADQDRRTTMVLETAPEVTEVTEVNEAVITPTVAESRDLPTERVNRYFEGLEKIYRSLPATDMTEDLAARLREGYEMVSIEDAEEDPEIAMLATIRMRQLDLALCLREERRALEKLDAVVTVASSDVMVMRTVLEDPTEYSVLGRLNVSSIFTGTDGRPVMYRIEDPVNGRTLAYVNSDSSLQLSEWIGQMIGVIGSMDFDSHWQVQIVDPNRVDLVAAISPTF